jgi:hypothetical protein
MLLILQTTPIPIAVHPTSDVVCVAVGVACVAVVDTLSNTVTPYTLWPPRWRCHEFLQVYYSVVTVLLQCCYIVVTVLLQCCYRVVTVLLQRCYIVVTVLLQCCYSVVTVLLQCCV